VADLKSLTASSGSKDRHHDGGFNEQARLVDHRGRPRQSVARDFTPPDTNDWLLVLDDASLDLPAPGKRQPVGAAGPNAVRCDSDAPHPRLQTSSPRFSSNREHV
jgi:hypothetical protein